MQGGFAVYSAGTPGNMVYDVQQASAGHSPASVDYLAAALAVRAMDTTLESTIQYAVSGGQLLDTQA